MPSHSAGESVPVSMSKDPAATMMSRHSRDAGSTRLARATEPSPDFFPGASLRSRLLARTLRMTVKPLLGAWSYCPHSRWPAGIVDQIARVLPSVDGVCRDHVRLANCDAEYVRARTATGDRVVLYLHGGGFLACGLNTHRRLASRISESASADVLAVDYRMLPTHPISDAVADGVNAYRWLLTHGFASEQIVIAGDSAGGFLTFMVTLALAVLGLPRPAGLVVLSPLTDLNPTTKLAHPDAGQCPLLPMSVLAALTAVSCSAERRSGGAFAVPTSPVDCALGGLPPVLIQVGSTDLLYPDAERMYRRLTAEGVQATLQVWERQVHVFHAAADLIPEARHAIERIGAFIQDVTAYAPQARAGSEDSQYSVRRNA